jgi:predicted transcriptional regulator
MVVMDAQKYVNDLLQTGLRQHQLADKLGCTQAAISYIANGKRGSRITYDLAQKLERLHKRLCKQSAKPEVGA